MLFHCRINVRLTCKPRGKGSVPLSLEQYMSRVGALPESHTTALSSTPEQSAIPLTIEECISRVCELKTLLRILCRFFFIINYQTTPMKLPGNTV